MLYMHIYLSQTKWSLFQDESDLFCSFIYCFIAWVFFSEQLSFKNKNFFLNKDAYVLKQASEYSYPILFKCKWLN